MTPLHALNGGWNTVGAGRARAGGRALHVMRGLGWGGRARRAVHGHQSWERGKSQSVARRGRARAHSGPVVMYPCCPLAAHRTPPRSPAAPAAQRPRTGHTPKTGPTKTEQARRPAAATATMHMTARGWAWRPTPTCGVTATAGKPPIPPACRDGCGISPCGPQCAFPGARERWRAMGDLFAPFPRPQPLTHIEHPGATRPG